MGDVAPRVVDVRLQQDRIARGLVDLDVEAIGQQALELGSVETGGAAHQGHAGRIEVELVLAHRLHDIRPARAGLPDSRRSPTAGRHRESARWRRAIRKYFEITGWALTIDLIFNAIEMAFITRP